MSVGASLKIFVISVVLAGCLLTSFLLSLFLMVDLVVVVLRQDWGDHMARASAFVRVYPSHDFISPFH